MSVKCSQGEHTYFRLFQPLPRKNKRCGDSWCRGIDDLPTQLFLVSRSTKAEDGSQRVTTHCPAAQSGDCMVRPSSKYDVPTHRATMRALEVLKMKSQVAGSLFLFTILASVQNLGEDPAEACFWGGGSHSDLGAAFPEPPHETQDLGAL